MANPFRVQGSGLTLGQVSGIEGLLVALGDNVGGVSISPAAEHLLSELILSGPSL